MLRSFLLPGLLTALAICITPVTSALAEDAPREQVFIEHWIVTAFEGDFLGYMAAMKAGDSEKVEWWIKRFHHQAFYYWLASRGPDKWIQPLPRADRTIAGLMRIGQIRDGIAEDWDPARLLRIERGVDGQLLETDLRQQETWMPGEAWMPGIPLKSLEDPLKYRELVAQFRTQLLEITANKTGEQAGTEQPATRSESKPEGSDKTQPASEGRSR
jgi:hypothetical protein